MKYKVRYEVEGFVENEVFDSEEKAREFYNDILLKLGNWIKEIDMWEVE